MNFWRTLKNYEDINYSLKDLLINCGEEEIQGLIYYYSNKFKKNFVDNKKEKELLE